MKRSAFKTINQRGIGICSGGQPLDLAKNHEFELIAVWHSILAISTSISPPPPTPTLAAPSTSMVNGSTAIADDYWVFKLEVSGTAFRLAYQEFYWLGLGHSTALTCLRPKSSVEIQVLLRTKTWSGWPEKCPTDKGGPENSPINSTNYWRTQ